MKTVKLYTRDFNRLAHIVQRIEDPADQVRTAGRIAAFCATCHPEFRADLFYRNCEVDPATAQKYAQLEGEPP